MMLYLSSKILSTTHKPTTKLDLFRKIPLGTYNEMKKKKTFIFFFASNQLNKNHSDMIINIFFKTAFLVTADIWHANE